MHLSDHPPLYHDYKLLSQFSDNENWSLGSPIFAFLSEKLFFPSFFESNSYLCLNLFFIPILFCSIYFTAELLRKGTGIYATFLLGGSATVIALSRLFFIEFWTLSLFSSLIYFLFGSDVFRSRLYSSFFLINLVLLLLLRHTIFPYIFVLLFFYIIFHRKEIVHSRRSIGHLFIIFVVGLISVYLSFPTYMSIFQMYESNAMDEDRATFSLQRLFDLDQLSYYLVLFLNVQFSFVLSILILLFLGIRMIQQLINPFLNNYNRKLVILFFLCIISIYFFFTIFSIHNSQVTSPLLVFLAFVFILLLPSSKIIRIFYSLLFLFFFVVMIFPIPFHSEAAYRLYKENYLEDNVLLEGHLIIADTPYYSFRSPLFTYLDYDIYEIYNTIRNLSMETNSLLLFVPYDPVYDQLQDLYYSPAPEKKGQFNVTTLLSGNPDIKRFNVSVVQDYGAFIRSFDYILTVPVTSEYFMSSPLRENATYSDFISGLLRMKANDKLHLIDSFCYTHDCNVTFGVGDVRSYKIELYEIS